MKHNRIALQIFKHQRNQLSPDELRELNEWLNANPINQEFYNKVTDPAWFRQMLDQFLSIDIRAAKHKVYKKIRRRETRR